ncbi:MAG: hypothetical protein CNCCGFBP_00761 [Fimbriimonadaceae bacterium]|nr:hypothetical protein [Fimbriimonadaceae bacterium]
MADDKDSFWLHRIDSLILEVPILLLSHSLNRPFPGVDLQLGDSTRYIVPGGEGTVPVFIALGQGSLRGFHFDQHREADSGFRRHEMIAPLGALAIYGDTSVVWLSLNLAEKLVCKPMTEYPAIPSEKSLPVVLTPILSFEVIRELTKSGHMLIMSRLVRSNIKRRRIKAPNHRENLITSLARTLYCGFELFEKG